MSERIVEKTSKPIRVLLISKYQLVRESLKLLIDANRDLAIAGSFSFTDHVAASDNLLNADVAVVYLSPGDRLEVISELIERVPALRVVLIITATDLDSQAAALKLGAVGIVHKEQSPKLLVEAIRQTFNGDTWLNQVLLNKLLERGKPNGKKAVKVASAMNTDALTTRELEVITMIGEGLKNKKIAERLNISEATVRHHLSSIYGKLGVDDRLNLVIFAYQKGLIKMFDLPLTVTEDE